MKLKHILAPLFLWSSSALAHGGSESTLIYVGLLGPIVGSFVIGVGLKGLFLNKRLNVSWRKISLILGFHFIEVVLFLMVAVLTVKVIGLGSGLWMTMTVTSFGLLVLSTLANSYFLKALSLSMPKRMHWMGAFQLATLTVLSFLVSFMGMILLLVLSSAFL